MSVGEHTILLIQANGKNSILDNYTVKRYTYNMNKEEIAKLLDQESYRIWDTTKIIKNQDYHDGLVKGLKLASRLVAKL